MKDSFSLPVSLYLSIVALVGLCELSDPAHADDVISMAVAPIVKANQFNAARTLLKSTDVIYDATEIGPCRSVAQYMETQNGVWTNRGFHRDYEARALSVDNSNCATYIREQTCARYSLERPWAVLPDHPSCNVIDIGRECVMVSKKFDLCRTRRVGFGDRLVRVGSQDPIVLRDRNRDDLIHILQP